ncbi:GHKL domain-containing protein [Polaribacter aestuariivivens]|uniref:histidine kinase n=1 Tax=Polaribacter aestuariivivens TaxID=2304626 RepID=A0A5S3N8M5_9FLAO|nr:ATP-binding protein [Polaribacter aestuariivivens]TMM31372.1 GHKL domain-containing protein [Polaribacter aestuariivivens]
MRTLILFLLPFTLFSQKADPTIYEKISSLQLEENNNYNIVEIVEKYEEGAFKKEAKPQIYKKLGTNTLWIHFSVNSSKKNRFKYFTNSNSYLAYGKIYLKRGDEIDSLQQVSNNENFPHKYVFYRDPVWKIPTDSVLKTDVFLKIINKNGRTRLLFHLENENEFLKRVETEYTFFGLYLAFLISMTLVLTFFAVLKKEYVVLFYAFYIVTAIIEFLAGKGLGVQYFWSDSSFLINNFRSLSQTLGTMLLGFFYLKFYKFGKNEKISKAVFRWGIILTIPLLCIYFYKFLYGGLESYFLTVWIILQLIVFTWIINHFYLTYKKQLPFYLVIAFVMPIVAVIFGQMYNPDVTSGLGVFFSGPNTYYLALAIEILLFTRFIFDSVINTQKQYFKLKKVSDELKYNFQNKALEIQHQEQNKLVSNVHDTFGGYLEALKLRLLQKTENTPEKIQEILDAFYKDYRYLLNSLYAPKINSENFVESLVEFCKKLNSLTEQDIKYDFKISNIDLHQEKCVHLYRIISELTTNAIKYSKSSEISILLHQKNNKILILEVIDNGIGLNQNTKTKKGFGLKNVKERVEQMKGILKIDTENNGTKFKIEVPINE